MRNIKLTIEYDGSRYDGNVIAKAGMHDKSSIGDKISQVLTEMEKVPVELIFAIRTEAGVHALAQVCTFKTESKRSTTEIKQYLNRYLPRDIAVLDVTDADLRFHPAFNAKKFTFEYHVTVGDVPSVFDRKYNYYCFKRPDVNKMRDAAAYLIGKHDFRGFSDNRKQKKSTEREIYSLDIYAGGNEISFNITADDFWPNMARIIVAFLISVGTGETPLDRIKEILETGNRDLAPLAIDPKGLFLTEVSYE